MKTLIKMIVILTFAGLSYGLHALSSGQTNIYLSPTAFNNSKITNDNKFGKLDMKYDLKNGFKFTTGLGRGVYYKVVVLSGGLAVSEPVNTSNGILMGYEIKNMEASRIQVYGHPYALFGLSFENPMLVKEIKLPYDHYIEENFTDGNFKIHLSTHRVADHVLILFQVTQE